MDPPEIISISPTTGPPSGGVIVVITGTGLGGVTSVWFGDTAAASFSIDGDSQISAESPAVGLSGAVYVVVSGDGGTSGTSDATTFTFEDSQSTVGDTESRAAAVCCCTAFNVPTGRSGCTSDGNKVGEKFRMEADFGSTDPGCTCSCCEYRQYVRGSFSVNDRPVRHLVPNPAGGAPVPMRARPAAGAADDFLEDGIPSPPAGINVYYWHRGEGSTDGSDTYAPDRATGCQYRGTDFPGVKSAPGSTYSIDLDFRGQIIDLCNGNQVKNSADWTVTCSGTI
jgi:hypothetical protein